MATSVEVTTRQQRQRTRCIYTMGDSSPKSITLYDTCVHWDVSPLAITYVHVPSMLRLAPQYTVFHRIHWEWQSWSDALLGLWASWMHIL